MPAPCRSPQDAAGKTVLVVEDEDVVRGLVRQVLEGAGFDVLVARDGAGGLRARGEASRSTCCCPT